MPRLAFVLVSVVAFASCKTDNLQSCELTANSGTAACTDGGTGGGACKQNDDCVSSPGFPLCDTAKSSGTCVQCMSGHTEQCIGPTPHCDLTTETCGACIDDNDCGSGTGVCLPNGACADPAKVIHAISSGGSVAMNTCGGMGVGNACDLDTALLAVRSGVGGKSLIKLDDAGPYKSNSSNFIVDVDTAIGLMIDARNATLHPNGDGPILTINAGKGLTILGGTIESATGSGGDGIRCGMGTLTVDGIVMRTNNESAINASMCTLTVTNARILDNGKTLADFHAGIEVDDGSTTISRSFFVSNRGGGLANNKAKFIIVGNVFLGNGEAAGSAFGGVSITMATKTGSRFEFNTIAENKSQIAATGGVQCTAATGFVAQNNVIWNNNSPLGVAGIQVGGACPHAYSDVGPASVPALLDSGNNMNADPSFASEMTDVHPNSGSMVHERANPGADLTGIASKDLDGLLRVARPGFGTDLGAYLVPAQ